MIKKGSKLYSILFNKCPKCHKGDFIIEKNIFKLHKTFKMYDNCSECGLKYMIEPSFFYGAMYINYSITVGIAIVTFTIGSLFFELSFIENFIPIILVLILTAPLSLRFSRIIWINIFVKYTGNTDSTMKNGQ